MYNLKKINLANKVIELFQSVLETKSISADTKIGDLEMDELDMLDAVMAFEDFFNIEISDEDWEYCCRNENTIQSIINYVGTKC